MGRGIRIGAFIVSLVALACGCLCSLLWILGAIGLPVAITALILCSIANKRCPGKLVTAASVFAWLAFVICTITFFTCGICYVLGKTAY